MHEAMTKEMEMAAAIEQKACAVAAPQHLPFLAPEEIEDFFAFSIARASTAVRAPPLTDRKNEPLHRPYVAFDGRSVGVPLPVLRDEDLLRKLRSVIASLKRDRENSGRCCIPCAVLNVGTKPGGRRGKCALYGCLRCGSFAHPCAACPVKSVKASAQAKVCYFCCLPLRRDLHAHVRTDGIEAQHGERCDSFARGVLLPVSYAIFNGKGVLSEPNCPIPPRARDNVVCFAEWLWSPYTGSSFCNSVHLVLWFVQKFRLA